LFNVFSYPCADRLVGCASGTVPDCY
jgi:hypothetical protein